MLPVNRLSKAAAEQAAIHCGHRDSGSPARISALLTHQSWLFY